MITEALEQVVKQYVHAHFEDAKLDISRGSNESADALLCKIQTPSGETYTLIVEDNALTGSEQEMLEQLEQYNPARVLSDMAGFPVTVSVNGCIV